MQSLAVGDWTTEDIVAELHRSGRTIDFRYELLDSLNNSLRDLDSVLAASVANNGLADIKRTAKFKMEDDPIVDWASHRIRPWFRLKMADPYVVDPDPVPMGLSLPGLAGREATTPHTGNGQPNGLYVGATAGHSAFTLDHPSLDVAGDIDVRWYDVALDDWTPPAQVVIGGKAGTSWHVRIGTTGLMVVRWYLAGVAKFAQSTIAIPGAVGKMAGLRWTRSSATGEHKFYTLVGGIWTQFGGTVAGDAGSITATSGQVSVGGDSSGLASMTGSIGRMSIHDGIDGPVVFDVDFRDSSQYWSAGDDAGDTGVDATGKIVTIFGSTSRILSPLDISGDIDIRVKVLAVDWQDAGGEMMVGKRAGTTDFFSWQFFKIGGTASIQFGWQHPDGTDNFPAFAGTPPVADGQDVWLRVTMDVDNGAGSHVRRLEYSFDSTNDPDDVVWILHAESVVAGVTSIKRTKQQIEVGGWDNGIDARAWNGNIYRVQIRNGIGGEVVYDADFTSYAQGWEPGDSAGATGVDSQGNVITINGADSEILGYDPAPYEVPAAWAEWPLGIFLLSTPKRNIDAIHVRRDVDAYDQLIVLKDDKVEDRYTVVTGTNVVTAVQTLLESAGFTKFNLVSTEETVPVDMEWEPGTEKLKIINELLTSINYRSLYFSGSGLPVARPYQRPDERPTEYTYASDSLSVLKPQVESGIDLFKVPNKWIAIVSEPDRPEMKATYTNDNPASPTSTVSRGRTILEVLASQEATSQEVLDGLVQKAAFNASQVYEHLKIDTALMPHHEDQDLISVDYDRLGALTQYVEHTWSMNLAAGQTMKHELRRVVSV